MGAALHSFQMADASKIYYCLLDFKKLVGTTTIAVPKQILLDLFVGLASAKLTPKEVAHHHQLNYLVVLC
jgi:hypothetical protein